MIRMSPLLTRVKSKCGTSNHQTIQRKILNSLLGQSHNTPLPPPPRPTKKKLRNHCFLVLLGHEDVLWEIKNNAYANFGGLKRCIMGFVQVVNLVVTKFCRGEQPHPPQKKTNKQTKRKEKKCACARS